MSQVSSVIATPCLKLKMTVRLTLLSCKVERTETQQHVVTIGVRGRRGIVGTVVFIYMSAYTVSFFTISTKNVKIHKYRFFYLFVRLSFLSLLSLSLSLSLTLSLSLSEVYNDIYYEDRELNTE